MPENFKTVGDAVAYCKEWGLNKSHASDDLFETAEALLKANQSGQAIVHNAINQQAKEMGGYCIVQAQPEGQLPMFRLPPKGLVLSDINAGE